MVSFFWVVKIHAIFFFHQTRTIELCCERLYLASYKQLFLQAFFLTRSISILVALLKFDLNFSCKRVNSVNNSFSSLRFCLAFLLAKIILRSLKQNGLKNVSQDFDILDCGLLIFLQ